MPELTSCASFSSSHASDDSLLATAGDLCGSGGNPGNYCNKGSTRKRW
ncbi:MAG TPA: hypothetical protein VMD28_07630 [Acidimicrobiales bacterium]|nr:hypothetical protein [Acidimicrobiales bacterium]